MASITAEAVVFPAVDAVEIWSFDLPDPRPGEMRVRTLFSGVSQGTEIWALTGRRNEIKFPTVPGYQGVGIVEEIGGDLALFSPGQMVFFKASWLPDPPFPPTWMGSHVSHALVKEAAPLPSGVDAAGASLAALSAVSLRGIRKIDIQPGDLVVVTGQGLIGQNSAQLARLRGATVVAADLSEARLALSRQHSADVVVNVRTENLAEVVKSLKPGGADVVIETTGRSDQWAPCISLLRNGGQLLLQGYYPDPITFDFWSTHLKQPLVAITCGFDLEGVAACLELTRWNKLRSRALVTHLVPAADAPDLYPRLAAADPSVLGVVFDWTAAS